jgi:Fe2+ or Zn2+ uptake regulation protein
MTTTKHNFDRPLADDAGNIHAAMCSRCGKTTELDGGDMPDAIKNEKCEPEDFSQSALA